MDDAFYLYKVERFGWLLARYAYCSGRALHELARDTNNRATDTHARLLLSIVQRRVAISHYARDVRYRPCLHITKLLMCAANADDLYSRAVVADLAYKGFYEFGTDIKRYQILVIRRAGCTTILDFFFRAGRSTTNSSRSLTRHLLA